MWRRRTAMVTVIMMVAAVGAVGSMPPTAAWAAGQGAQIFGDVNGDGIIDRITLGVIEPDLCSVIVEYGIAPGVYQPPVASAYLKPGGSGIATRCPTLGVAVALGPSRRRRNWWSPGIPARRQPFRST